MPPRRRSRQRDAAKQETRAALIQAGLQEFFERGFDAPSLDAICARAGYTRGAFYVHFEDREDFFVAVMDSVLGGFLDGIIATDTSDDIEETVLRFARALIEGNPILGERGAMRSHQLLDACARSEPIRRQFLGTIEEGIRRVRQAAQQGQRDGLVRDDVDAAPLATALVALALGVLQMYELGLRIDYEPLRAAVVRLLRPSIESTPSMSPSRPSRPSRP